jgi:hypothetical protein
LERRLTKPSVKSVKRKEMLQLNSSFKRVTIHISCPPLLRPLRCATLRMHGPELSAFFGLLPIVHLPIILSTIPPLIPTSFVLSFVFGFLGVSIYLSK